MHDSESKYFRRIKHIKDKEWESNNHMIPNAKPFAFVICVETASNLQNLPSISLAF